MYEGKPDNKVKVRDVFKGKKGVLFGVPGELISLFALQCAALEHETSFYSCHTVVLAFATSGESVEVPQLALTLCAVNQVHSHLDAQRPTCPAMSATTTS